MSQILVHRDGGVMVLTLNRPDKRNALTQQMYSSLSHALIEAEKDDEVRVILIQGQEEAFCAGNDLVDFLSMDGFDSHSPVVTFIRLLPTLTKPIVAAVSGPAVGIGTTLLLHCDLVYCSPTAIFQLPFINLGLLPEAGSSLLLPRLCGRAKAAELLMLGDPFCADSAVEIGIVNRIVAADQVLQTALDKSHALADKPKQALKTTKALLQKAQPTNLAKTIDDELAAFSRQLKSEETKARIAAKLKS